MKALATVLIVICLSGCATTSSVPSTLLTCAPQPQAPAAGTQRDVGLYIVDLAAAGDDCRTKLGSVARILNSPEPK